MTSPDTESAGSNWVRLPWDSDHFGIQIGRLVPASLSESALSKALKSAEEAGIRCLYWLAERTDFQADSARRAGFRMVDVRVDLEIQVGSLAIGTRNDASLGPDQAVRIAVDLDLAPLRSLAAQSHHNTRFYTDSNFPRDRAGALYVRWIERALSDPLQEVLVSGPPGAPSAYVCCDLGRQDGVGAIGLIAVAETSRGKGLGTTLVQKAIEWFTNEGASRIVVATQGENYAAQSLYRKLGFMTTAKSNWFHRWS